MIVIDRIILFLRFTIYKMKAALTVSFLVFILISDGFGQVYLGPKVGFGISKSRFNFKDDEALFDQKWKTSYQVGGAFDLPVLDIVHFYTELYYINKGKKTVNPGIGLTNTSSYHMIEAPVFLRLTFAGGKSAAGIFNWHVDFGPTLSYWISGNGKLDGTGPELDYKLFFSDPEGNTAYNKMYLTEANRLLWGLAIGTGLEIPVKDGQYVFIDFRGGFGSSNLAKNEGEFNLPILGFSDSPDVRFVEITMSAAYIFAYDWKLSLKGKSTINKRKQR